MRGWAAAKRGRGHLRLPMSALNAMPTPTLLVGTSVTSSPSLKIHERVAAPLPSRPAPPASLPGAAPAREG